MSAAEGRKGFAKVELGGRANPLGANAALTGIALEFRCATEVPTDTVRIE
jgi:hypothetical protein